jgi:hypothetical protein
MAVETLGWVVFVLAAAGVLAFVYLKGRIDAISRHLTAREEDGEP